jgi:hypothetical protein
MAMNPVFQVVTIKHMSGTSKAGNLYDMLIVGGLFTDIDGVVEMGEITFMLGRDRTEFPMVSVGKKYTPVIGARSNAGKLEFKITDLKAVMEAAPAKAA